MWNILKFTWYLVRLQYSFRRLQIPKNLEPLVADTSLALRLTAVYMPLDLWLGYSCLSVDEVIERRSWQAAVVFILYVQTWDAYVDSEKGSREFSKRPVVARTGAPFREILSDLAKRILQIDTPRANVGRIVSSVRMFIRHGIEMCKADLERRSNIESPSLPWLLTYRYETSGAMYRTFASILDLAHNIPHDRAKQTEVLLTYWGLAAQVIDDIFDLAWDYQHNQNNLALALLELYPEERIAVIATISEDNILPPLIPLIAPRLYGALRQNFVGYLDHMCRIDPQNAAIRQARKKLEDAFTGLTSRNSQLWLRSLLYVGRF